MINTDLISQIIPEAGKPASDAATSTGENTESSKKVNPQILEHKMESQIKTKINPDLSLVFNRQFMIADKGDDLLDETYIRETDAKDALQVLREPGIDRVAQVYRYVKQHNLPRIPEDEYTDAQTFTYEGEKYIINENHALRIYTILLRLDEPAVLHKSLSRGAKTLNNVQEYLLKNTPQVFTHPLLQAKTFSFIVRVTVRCLTEQLNKLLLDDPRVVSFNKNKLAIMLGKALVEGHVLMTHLYDLSSTEEEDEETRKGKVPEYPRKSKEELTNILEQLTTNYLKAFPKCTAKPTKTVKPEGTKIQEPKDTTIFNTPAAASGKPEMGPLPACA